MVRDLSFKKISFNTTKIEETFLQALNQNYYHATTITQFMHNLLTDFMGRCGTLGSSTIKIPSVMLPSNGEVSTETKESLLLRLASLYDSKADALTIMKTIKQLDELEEKERAPKTDKQNEREQDPNQQYKIMAKRWRLWAECVDSCARIRKGRT